MLLYLYQLHLASFPLIPCYSCYYAKWLVSRDLHRTLLNVMSQYYVMVSLYPKKKGKNELKILCCWLCLWFFECRPGSVDVPQKPSPTTPRTGRKLKTPGSDSDSFPSPSPVSRTPKDRSPKVVDRRSPRSPATTEVYISVISTKTLLVFMLWIFV